MFVYLFHLNCLYQISNLGTLYRHTKYPLLKLSSFRVICMCNSTCSLVCLFTLDNAYKHIQAHLRKKTKHIVSIFEPVLRILLSISEPQVKNTLAYKKKTCNDLTQYPKKFWEQLKKMNRTKSSSISNYISKDEWMSHFKSLNNKDPSLYPQNYNYCKEVEDEVENILANYDCTTSCDILEKDITIHEVVFVMKHLKSGKASALDSISNDILKASCSLIAPILVILFNKLIKLIHFPTLWKTGMIILLHKSGELDDPNKFRGITLNSSISKIFTLLMNERLTSFCDSKGLINYNQIGFRKGFCQGKRLANI